MSEEEKEVCKVCKKSFKALLRHIALKESCQEKYDEEEMAALKNASKAKYQKYQKDYKANNREILKQKHQDYNLLHSEEIRLKKAKYDEEKNGMP